LGDGGLSLARRSFDQLAVADALGLQTIVEPYGEGDLTFGHSMRSWVSKTRPGALGMTWLLARDEAEKLAIRARARQIIEDFREVRGFIGLVTGFAGLHGFTLTAWESEEALRVATHSGAHSEALMQRGGHFACLEQPRALRARRPQILSRAMGGVTIRGENDDRAQDRNT
jgi:hypothetical protein